MKEIQLKNSGIWAIVLAILFIGFGLGMSLEKIASTIKDLKPICPTPKILVTPDTVSGGYPIPESAKDFKPLNI